MFEILIIKSIYLLKEQISIGKLKTFFGTKIALLFLKIKNKKRRELWLKTNYHFLKILILLR